MQEDWLKLKSCFLVLSSMDDNIEVYGKPKNRLELCNLAATLAKGARASAGQKRKLAERMRYIAFGE